MFQVKPSGVGLSCTPVIVLRYPSWVGFWNSGIDGDVVLRDLEVGLVEERSPRDRDRARVRPAFSISSIAGSFVLV